MRRSGVARGSEAHVFDQASVFPTGLTPYGLPYGTAVTLPVPFEEINNPNYTTCSARGA